MTHEAKPKNDGHDQERIDAAQAKRDRKNVIRYANSLPDETDTYFTPVPK